MTRLRIRLAVAPIMVLVTSFFGGAAGGATAGSRELTDWTHRYRLESGRVRLIGLDRTVTDRLGPSVVTRSTNLLTGVTVTTVDGEPEQPVKTGTVKSRPRTVWLEDVVLD